MVFYHGHSGYIIVIVGKRGGVDATRARFKIRVEQKGGAVVDNFRNFNFFCQNY
ncbi:hypothetical protein SBF1_8150002 [Candidatus Desulfosporosinus infrequens]|uniref:Uncharacterized protein n=1 Tax=Candidatus Desulfosporosinus infrequens TaxID=2043169 RepID=A0A2U3LTZ2_9FIRM|nr:hypothetical protein SBF1_8150002 [Candidatus Desulfosporosinus infrequens]